MSNADILDTRFRSALRRMLEQGRLRAYEGEADPKLEIAAIMKKFDGEDAAILFGDVAGHDVPVVGNLLSNKLNCEAAFGCDFRAIRTFIGRAIGSPLPPVVVERAPAHEEVHRNGFDIGAMLPVLTHTPADGGRFITAGVVVARDPETGVYNASYHRLQLLDAQRTAIRLDYGRHLRSAWERAKAKGEHLPIAVCIGADIALQYTAATMGSQMPENADEIAVAGGLCGRPLPVAKAVSQDLLVPADSEIVLEGVIRTDATVREGPFGEFVGYLANAEDMPIVEVTALTHRRRPVYHAINGYGRETIMLRKYVLEASLLKVLGAAVPCVVDAEMTAGGLHRFHAIIQVKKSSPGPRGFAAQRDPRGVRRAQGPRPRDRGRSRHRHPRPAGRRIRARHPHGGLARPDRGAAGARPRIRAHRRPRHHRQARHRRHRAVRRAGAVRPLQLRAGTGGRGVLRRPGEDRGGARSLARRRSFGRRSFPLRAASAGKLITSTCRSRRP